MHYSDEIKRNIKYGEYDKLDDKMKDLSSEIEKLESERITKEKEVKDKIDGLEKDFNEKVRKLDLNFKEKEKQYYEIHRKLQADKDELENELNSLHKDLIIESINVDDYSSIPSEEIKNKLQLLKLEQDTIIKNDNAVVIEKLVTNDSKKYIN